MFLIVAHESYRHGGERYRSLKEFASDEEADSYIIAHVDDFHPQEDGGGTWFIRVNESGYMEKAGKYFVLPEHLHDFTRYEYPEGIRDKLEPY